MTVFVNDKVVELPPWTPQRADSILAAYMSQHPGDVAGEAYQYDLVTRGDGKHIFHESGDAVDVSNGTRFVAAYCMSDEDLGYVDDEEDR